MSSPVPSNRTVHVPVMLREVLDHLSLEEGLTVLDGTVGAGGHSQEIIKHIGNTGRLIGFDRDQTMLDRAAQVISCDQASLHHASYADALTVLENIGISQVDRVLLDLGLSSDQLADPTRGFGFDTKGGLDMRFDSSSGETVQSYLAQASHEEITTILTDFGEEKFADRIASTIVHKRKQSQPIQSVEQLIDVVLEVTGRSSNRRSPSVTRVFQALRIAINNELEHLDRFLEHVAPPLIRSQGRIAVITFHSLEDRRVKQAFKNKQLWNILTSKPIVPTASEVRRNPRARSAKLRVAERT